MITIKNLSICFGSHSVLEKFHAEIAPGLTAIVGPSGCGKTTLLRAIAGLQPYQGTIDGVAGQKIAFAFQDYRLFPAITVKQNILACMDPKTDYETLKQDFRFADFENKYPSELSGGMKQRISLARAAAYQAPIVLLDEPFNALDDVLKQHIIKILPQYLQGKTVIVVTHDQTELALLNPQQIIPMSS